MFKMMKEQPKINSLSQEGQTSSIEGEIEMKNVGFSYPRAPEHRVLNNLSLRARTAKSLALVGPSGCKKLPGIKKFFV